MDMQHTVGSAIEVAREWVYKEGRHRDGYVGAYVAGSMCWLPSSAPLPPDSDVDIMLVVDCDDPGIKPGKFTYRDVVLEVSVLPESLLHPLDQLLATYRIVPSVHAGVILDDPTGRLTHLQRNVRERYAHRDTIRQRLDNVEASISSGLDHLNENAPFHEQVIGWIFPTGITTHLMLVAALQNPTVRKRYLNTRHVLEQYGHESTYESLLGLLGCANLTPDRVCHHLDAMTEVFDTTSAVDASRYPFGSDLGPQSRPIAVDGSASLIETGNHREAIFWIAVTYARCLTVLTGEAPHLISERHEHSFRELTSDLGVASFPDIQARANLVRQRLPDLRATADAIVTSNPEVIS